MADAAFQLPVDVDSLAVRRRPSNVSPYDYSKAVVNLFLEVRESLGASATIQDVARRLSVSASSFHYARAHVEAVESCNLNHWQPRNEALKEWQRQKPSTEDPVSTETERLIESAIKTINLSAETLTRFDPSAISGYLNGRTSKRRQRVRASLRDLEPWMTQLRNELR